MNIKEIRELIELIENSAIEEFEMERSGSRIRFRRSPGRPAGSAGAAAPAETRPALPIALEAVQPEPPPREESLYAFKAPIVGTFYLTPKPDAESLVQIGTQVDKGTVLCIIEAMKIFNQIESDVKGEIVRILAENGQPVEYGQPLFEIRLAS